MSKARTTTALDAAVRLLGHRPRSRAALLRLLVSKGYPASNAAAAVARVQQLGYLKEDDYARGLARDLLAQGHAPDSALGKLLAKELDEGTARRALDAALDESGWSALEAARQLMQKKRVTGPKAMRLLLSRGFDEDVARLASGVQEP